MSGRQGKKSPVVSLLTDLGFVKVRSRKHNVWHSPGGKAVTVSVSPGSMRTMKNEMSHVKRIAREEGLINEDSQTT